MKRWITAFLIGSVLTVAAPSTDGQGLKERITWTYDFGQGFQAIALYDSGSTYQSARMWNFGGWRLVGTAGNRILWELGAGSQHARLGKITDDGDRLSHVDLTPPAPGYKARSLSLASAWLGACYDRDDADQSYWILWERDVPNTQIHVQMVKGDGTIQLTHLITKPVEMGTRAALSLAQIYGNDLVVLFAADNFHTSLWRIGRFGLTMRFDLEWLFVANPIRVSGGGVFAPVSLNAYYNDPAVGGDGAIVQIMFKDVSRAFSGRAMILNVRETNSTPFGRRAFKREIWTHTSSNNTTIYDASSQAEATAHTILPSACP